MPSSSLSHSLTQKIDELSHWMEGILRSLSAKSDTAAAIRYALSHGDGVWLTDLGEGSSDAQAALFFHPYFRFKRTAGNYHLYTATAVQVGPAKPVKQQSLVKSRRKRPAVFAKLLPSYLTLSRGLGVYSSLLRAFSTEFRAQDPLDSPLCSSLRVAERRNTSLVQCTLVPGQPK